MNDNINFEDRLLIVRGNMPSNIADNKKYYYTKYGDGTIENNRIIEGKVTIGKMNVRIKDNIVYIYYKGFKSNRDFCSNNEYNCLQPLSLSFILCSLKNCKEDSYFIQKFKERTYDILRENKFI